MSLLNTLRKLGNHIGAYKVHLCPEVKGQITDHGKPLANVKIERTLSFSDGKYVEDHTFTDENGAFSLPEVNIRSGQPAIPFAEVFTSQAIYFTYKKIEYRLWISRLPSFKFRAEFADKLSTLNADLKDEKIIFKFDNRNKEGYKFEAVSICRWDDDFEIVDKDSYFDLSGVNKDKNAN
ncbi:hypothetical protein MSP8887_04174 [Marinomonas spartinae]|uniref:DUF6795 domain-containing protein n=1 Tax=Marinomonas spartinae TaxID=1792290 RepID=UPI000808FFD4|nr:carboxypeptidase-like regulatory domain-containing protein [Marinomonas spartinae]SBS40084.1 hypothetical protein MSP8887_04174 [Marinomonas spartinae]